MRQRLYSVRDLKAEIFGPMFSSRTDSEAARNFDRLRRDPQSNIHQYPEDYQLFFMAEFDDATGSVVQREVPQLVPLSQDQLASAA